VLKLLSETHIFSVVFVITAVEGKGLFLFLKTGLANPTISLT